MLKKIGSLPGNYKKITQNIAFLANEARLLLEKYNKKIFFVSKTN
jgi:hypothetical protein